MKFQISRLRTHALPQVALDFIADGVADFQPGRVYPDLDRFINAWAPQQTQTAAETIKRFAKKPRLRCRDAKTGRFLKMEVCKKSPETTVVERVKK